MISTLKKWEKTWDSKEEKNPRWQPGYTGEGDWYLSHGGDCITYNIYIPESDTYHLWIRDFCGEYHRIGSRAVYFIISNTGYGPINENSERKGFKWNYALSLDIKKGSYIAKIVKARTTSAATIIDAFILTNNKNYLPEEQNIGKSR